jgi:hypothetical protein
LLRNFDFALVFAGVIGFAEIFVSRPQSHDLPARRSFVCRVREIFAPRFRGFVSALTSRRCCSIFFRVTQDFSMQLRAILSDQW